MYIKFGIVIKRKKALLLESLSSVCQLRYFQWVSPLFYEPSSSAVHMALSAWHAAYLVRENWNFCFFPWQVKYKRKEVM